MKTKNSRSSSMQKIKERPILFSAPMVRAIIDGRKTQTRRIIKPQPIFESGFDDPHENEVGVDWKKHEGISVEEFLDLCPYGKKGHHLWVRETFGFVDSDFDGIEWIPDRPVKKANEIKLGNGYYSGNIIYAADGYFEWGREDSDEPCSLWHPSIHMPRTASRINLEITNIRVERLQDISEEDVLSEGFKEKCKDGCLIKYGLEDWAWRDYRSKYCDAFKDLWNSINGVGSWELNPWVWVIEFRRA